MEELVKKIEQIINQFATEELGNRPSQFAIIPFKDMIINEIKKYSENIEKYGFYSIKDLTNDYANAYNVIGRLEESGRERKWQTRKEG